MLHDDIVLAQRIVSGSHCNFGKETPFHNVSAIYKISNERIQDYINYFKDKKSVLSVIGSGDQILSSIFAGIKEVDAFDISVFPKYFLKLKMAAVKALSRTEYLNFFYGLYSSNEYYDDLYDEISVYLESDDERFWNSLISFFDWKDIYNSMLFSSEPYSESSAVFRNKYLQSDENYETLKQNLDGVVVNCYTGDIFKLINELPREYDLIYLSNILNYNKPEDFVELLGNLKLTDKGISISYIYVLNDVVKQLYDDPRIAFEQFTDNPAGLMISHK